MIQFYSFLARLGRVNDDVGNDVGSPASFSGKSAIRSWLMLAVCLLSSLTWQVRGQANAYTVATATGATLDPMTGSTQLVAAGLDDGISALTNIGFSFNFAGTAYTQFSANSNGLLRLGALIPTGTAGYSNSATNAGTNNGALFPYWDDLATGSAASGSKVHYVVTGTAPNRVLVVEWFLTVPRSTSAAANAKFQALLYETSNVIEYRYGAIPTGASYSIGIATSSTAYTSIDGATNLASTTSFTTATTAAITAGRSFTFTPPVACSGAPAVGSVSPASQTVCSTVTPSAISLASLGVVGVTYQWQQSTDGGTNWVTAVGGSGATTTTYTPPSFAGSSILYRVLVTCTASSLSTPSAVATVGPQEPPTIQASASSFTSALTSKTINWTAGNGGRRYVVVNTTNSFTNPTGTAPVTVAGTAYTSGEQIVYDGAGTSVTITGLTEGATYYVRIYEYNRCAGTPTTNFYNVSTNASNPASFTGNANNDACANAITLASCTGSSQSLAASTVGATADPYIDCGAGGTLTAQAGIWYKYIGDNSNVTITTCDATGYDTRLTVYSGSCGNFTCMGGNDDMGSTLCPASSNRSQVNFNAVAGTEYYVFVHGYQTGSTLSATGSFVLSWSCTALCTPATGNDTCATATALTVGTALASNNACASAETGTAYPSCATAGQFATYYDAWYSFNSGSNTTLEVSLAAVAPAVVGFTVYSGACGTLTQIGCADTGAATNVTGLSPNTVYYVRAWSSASASRGSYSLRVKVPCLPPTNVQASNLTPTTADLSWTAPATAPGSGYEYALTTSATAPASGTATTATSYAASNLTSGTVYYFHVRAVCAPGDFSPWATRAFRYLVGDNCALAIDLGALTSPVAGTTVGATDDYSPSCNSTTTGDVGPDMFYKLSVPAGYTVVMGLTASDYDSVHSMYYGTCATENSIACSDTEITNHTWTNTTGVTQTVYWVQDAWYVGSGTYTLAWTLTPPPIVVTSFAPAAGCSASLATTTVVITGSNFTNATDVRLNNVSMPFAVNSDTQITVSLTASATSGTFTVYNAVTQTTSTGSFTVNASPTVDPITAPGGATFVCLPNTITLSTATPTGVWTSSNLDVATVNTSGLVTPLTTGSVVISYTVTNASTGCATSQTYALTINEPVAVTSSTLSQSVTTNGNTSFTVTATGSGTPALAYQWFVSADGAVSFEPVVDGGVFSGATSATLTLTGVPAEYNGYYFYATVTGACNADDSEIGALIVGDTGIESQPESVNICENGSGTASFTVVASEDVTTYEWYEDQGGDNWMPLTEGGMYAGVSTPTLTLTGVTQANNNWRYKAVVYGIGVAESNPASLTVVQTASFTSNPTAQTTCYTGGSAQFTAAATGGFTGYVWEYSTGTTWATVANGTPVGATYTGINTGTLTVTTSATTPAAGTYLYRATAVATAPCANVASDSAQLLINNPTIATQPVATTVSALQPSSASFTVSANTTLTAGYQWQYATAAAGPWTNVADNTPAGITYSGATAQTLTVSTATTATASTARYYRVVVSSGAGCSVNSNAAQLTVTNYCVPAAITGTASYFNAFATTGGLTNISNTTTMSTGGYGNYTNLSASQYPGQVVNFTTGLTGTTVGVAIFADWNRDGDFTDAGEVLANTTSYVSTFNGSFTVPASATPGPVRLRIYMDWSRSNLSTFPCGPFAGTRGEMEDYTFDVVALPACSGTPTAGTITASVPSVCVSGTSTLTATGYSTTAAGLSYQWYNSAGAIASATGFTYTTPVLTAPETYYFRVTCANSGLSADSNSVTIGVNNPSVTASQGATRCGTGTVNLTATGSAGATLNWYAGPTGGAPIGTGTTFTTPSINATTIYYVSAATGSSSSTVGKATSPGTDGSFVSTSYGIVMSATTEITLNSAVIYPVGTGTITVALYNSSGTELASTAAIPVTGTGLATPVNLPLGFTIPAGTGYRVLVKSYTGITGLIRDFSATYPYTSANASVTGSWTGSASTAYYFFYNLSVSTGCNSARTAVTATVNTPPTLTLSSATAGLCAGGSTAVVSITAGASDYDTFTWSPNTNVSGNAASGYTFNPSVSTPYTLTATNSVSGCATTATVNVTVNPYPSALTFAPAAPSLCSTDGAVMVTVGSASSPTAGGCLTAPNGQWPTGTYTPATCNGTTSNVIATNCYAGEFSVVSVSANTRYTFGSALAGDRVTVSDSSGAVVLASGLGSAVYVSATAGTVRVYTHLTSTACGSDSTNRARTVICEPLQAAVFSPNTGLYTDAAATTPYTGAAVYSVYAKPTATTPYTVTATSAAGCTTTGSVTVTVNQATTWYVDADGDGYGNSALATVQACVQPVGYAAVGGDCNDAVAAINPGHAEVLYNGVDDNCDGNLDEGFQITTKLLQSYCGATLTSISSLIGIQTLAPGSAYTGWRVRATNGAQVQTIEVNVPHFMMTQFPSYAYATTYTIEIELQRNGVWLGYYGQPCLVSTPAILEEGGAAAVSGAQCGQTLPKINTLISTTSILGVTGYRFRVTNLTDPSGPFAEQVVTRGVNWFTLQMLTRYNYGTTYRIEVAVKTTADFGGYGAPCQVSSPAAPTLVNCGATATSGTQTIAATSSQGVTQYRFQITRASDNASTSIDRSVNYFTFNQVPATIYTAGALYYVRVAVMTTGYWSPYGDACELTAPGGVAKGETSTAADAALSFKATAYPNPFAQDFGIEIISPSQDSVTLKVYDMLGKLLESRDIPAAEMNVEKIGANYPSGVYNVIVSQSGNVRTLRVIKR